MSATSFRQIESHLRAAIADGRYGAVKDLAAAFCAAAAAEAKALPQGDPELGRIVRHVEEVLGWAYVMLSTARANCAAELRRISILNRYLGRGQNTASGVRLDG